MQIDRSKYHVHNKLSLSTRIRDFFLTLFLWGVWLYIMFPLLGLISWYLFGIDIFYYLDDTKKIDQLADELIHLLVYGGSIVIAASAMLLFWGYYNKERFKQHRNRRKREPIVIDSETMANSLKVDADSIRKCQNARYIQVYHTDKPTRENNFKKVEDKDISNVKLYFCNNWDQVREESQFGYTHQKR